MTDEVVRLETAAKFETARGEFSFEEAERAYVSSSDVTLRLAAFRVLAGYAPEIADRLARSEVSSRNGWTSSSRVYKQAEEYLRDPASWVMKPPPPKVPPTRMWAAHNRFGQPDDSFFGRRHTDRFN